jgi:hypothetical protein
MMMIKGGWLMKDKCFPAWLLADSCSSRMVNQNWDRKAKT